MAKECKHKKIIKFIKAVRESFPDASIIYQYGACYGFYKIMKSVFPESKAFVAGDDRHVAVKIGGKLYDVSGEVSARKDENFEGFSLMSDDDHDHWDGVVYGQRVEHMIRKLD